jgi:NAD(P)-dependent dehydrogenase (short-subunit alcohol dehydrogenase family)
MKDLADAHTHKPELVGRRALVTGGTTGIGRAIAVLLASCGVRVFVCGTDPDHLHDALARIRDVGDGEGMIADVGDPAALAGLFDAAVAHLGGLDIVVVNAGVPAGALAETDPDAMRRQVGVDFVAYLATAQHAATRMGAGSDIILIGSTTAESRKGGSSIYVAAKSGIQGFATSLRRELAEMDIKVGLIEPGFTGADFHHPDFDDEAQRRHIAEDRMLRAEDIAVAAHAMLTQPRRAAMSLIRVETRLEHP